jgi:hypothetical protein
MSWAIGIIGALTFVSGAVVMLSMREGLAGRVDPAQGAKA